MFQFTVTFTDWSGFLLLLFGWKVTRTCTDCMYTYSLLLHLCTCAFASAMYTFEDNLPSQSSAVLCVHIVSPPCFLVEVGFLCFNSLSLSLAGVDFFRCFLAGGTQEHALIVCT